eukprot:CAMPEP_0170486810 /NCGR_PEP_ID=MMETSP0208-20121228/5738_1 /TAXON_ID=197538 /ORGANISM="Strombidium inclinatum, Strain S3" /LENGTH=231 /DNA_ID=CAMNT_0010760871 /DNA_START=374 /DNA_END=1069 /DNA_ORIENTATION=+
MLMLVEEHVAPLIEGDAVLLVAALQIVAKGGFLDLGADGEHVHYEWIHCCVFVLLDSLLNLANDLVPVETKQVDFLIPCGRLVFEPPTDMADLLVEQPPLLDQLIDHLLLKEELTDHQLQIHLSESVVHYVGTKRQGVPHPVVDYALYSALLLEGPLHFAEEQQAEPSANEDESTTLLLLNKHSPDCFDGLGRKDELQQALQSAAPLLYSNEVLDSLDSPLSEVVPLPRFG